MRTLLNVIIAEDDKGYIHLPGDSQTTFSTLCGYCDVHREGTDRPANCPDCFSTLAFVREEFKGVRIPVQSAGVGVKL